MRKILITLFFIAILVSPATGFILKSDAFFRESPFMATMPAVTAGALFEKSFYKGVESYLDIRNPFRSLFIRSKSWSDVRIFKTSSAKKVHLGINGWAYYKPGLLSYLKVERSRKIEAIRLARNLHRLENKLKKAGKRFIFIVAPDKATIYPENIGWVRSPNGYDKNFY